MDGTNPQPQADNQPPAQPMQDVVAPPQAEQPMSSNPDPMQPNPAMSPQPQMMSSAPMQAMPTSVDPGHSMGVASLILAFIFPLVGLILGIIAKGKSKKAGKSNGLALAGIIISSLSIVAGIIIAVVLVAAGASVAAKCKNLGPGSHYDNGTTISCS